MALYNPFPARPWQLGGLPDAGTDTPPWLQAALASPMGAYGADLMRPTDALIQYLSSFIPVQPYVGIGVDLPAQWGAPEDLGGYLRTPQVPNARIANEADFWGPLLGGRPAWAVPQGVPSTPMGPGAMPSSNYWP